MCKLLDVGGVCCDYCKRKDIKLSRCSNCNRGFYCSKECQAKQWREKCHKKYCRKAGQFEPGDLVMTTGLEAEALNGCIVEIVGRDSTSREEEYIVQMNRAINGNRLDFTPKFSVKPENLNQLRPYDCRN